MRKTAQRAARVAVVTLAAGLLWGVTAGTASAHPLGNFSVNRYDGLLLHKDQIVDNAIVDFAEIPTLQAQSSVDADGNGKVAPAESHAYAMRTCSELAGVLRARADGQPLKWSVTQGSLTYHAGAAGLQTSRLSCALRTPVRLDHPVSLEFTNDFRGDRVGWREITAKGEGVRLASSSVPAKSVSAELRTYPRDLLSTPLDLRTAQIKAEPGTGSGTSVKVPVPGGDLLGRWTGALTNTVDRLASADRLTIPVGLLALLLALVLGGAHAALPGHGKTVMAAYIAGRQGRLRDALVVGATVTLTHTAGVLVLGLLLTLSASVAGDSLLAYLGVLSGLLIAVIGGGLLLSAVQHLRQGSSHPQPADAYAPELVHTHAMEPTRTGALSPLANGHGLGSDHHAHRLNLDHASLHEAHGQDHDHGRGHGHDHGHGHGQGHGHDHGRGQGQGRRALVGLGIAGGLVPSPSALVVLLGAIALGRTAFGVAMVISYGLGMAATLTAAGLLLVWIRDGAQKAATRRGLHTLRRLQPYTAALTAGLVLIVGVGLAARSLGPLL